MLGVFSHKQTAGVELVLNLFQVLVMNLTKCNQSQMAAHLRLTSLEGHTEATFSTDRFNDATIALTESRVDTDGVAKHLP